jgi:exopolysaccharide production protein ExoQ
MTSHPSGTTAGLARSVHDLQHRRRGRSIDRLAGWLGAVAEQVYVIITLFFMSGAELHPSPGTGGPLAGDSSLTASAVFTPIYLIMAVLIAMRSGPFFRAAKAHKLTLLLLMVAVASLFWSDAPDISLRRIIAILATSAFGWYLVGRYPARDIFRLVAITLGLTAVLSVSYWMINPNIVILPADLGGWRGIYGNKNVLARAMVLSAVSFMLLGLERGRYRWMVWAGLGLSTAMVLASDSKTGLVLLVLLALFLRSSGSLRLHVGILIPFLIACTFALIGGIIWLQSHAQAVAVQLGKDPTLTGRTDVWAVAMLMIQHRPWLGYGYGGFWLGWGGESAQFWRAIGWETPHSHNGFLDLTLDLGLVGLATFLAGLATATKAAIYRARASITADAVGPLVLLAFILFYNLTESSILRQNTIFWVLYVVAVSASCGGSPFPRVTGHALGAAASLESRWPGRRQQPSATRS